MLKQYPILLLLAFITILNIPYFVLVDRSVNTNTRALNMYASDEAWMFAHHSPAIRGYYSQWLSLGILAPNSVVYTSTEWTEGFAREGSIPQRVHGFGRSKLKTISHMDLIDVDKLNIKKYIIAVNEDPRPDSPYSAIAIRHNEDRLQFQELSRGTLIAKDIYSPGLEFILVRWQGPDEPFTENRTDNDNEGYRLLLDLRLLPNDIAERVRNAD